MEDFPRAAALQCTTLPDLTHLGSADYEQLYEPSDDTFLLIDALSADIAGLRQLRPAVCVELGSGSGTVITHLTSLLAPTVASLATDINRAANTATVLTGTRNGQRIEAVRMDLLSALRPGTIDVLVFNPPYVPTSPEELHDAEARGDISAAWAGGERGREVLDRLLPHIRTCLAPTAFFYLLGVSENDPAEISEILAAQGFHAETIAQRRAQNERLFVIRFSRKSDFSEANS